MAGLAAGVRFVAVISETDVSSRELQACVAAWQIQINRDVIPAWQLPETELRFVSRGTTPPPGWWELVIRDDLAVEAQERTLIGQPLAVVYTRMLGEASLSYAGSAALVSMLADPHVRLNEAVTDPSGVVTAVYAREIALPTRGLGYDVQLENGALIEVADFITPRWFDLALTPPLGTVYPSDYLIGYDHLEVLKAPRTAIPTDGAYLWWTPAVGWRVHWDELRPNWQSAPGGLPDLPGGSIRMTRRWDWLARTGQMRIPTEARVPNSA